jgi:hypothetical protein
MPMVLLNKLMINLKMKKIQIILSMLVATFVATSCTDFVEPAIPYNGFETGTYLKTITAPAPINFFDIDNANFSTLLECHAIDKINNVKELDVFVKHRRGNTVSPEVKLTTIAGSSFTSTGDSKWPRGTVAVKVADALAKLGFIKTNIKGGDFLEYRLLLTTNDNKVFTNNNLTADVSGGEYYASPFFYRVAVVCPSALQGTYEYSTTDIKSGPGGTLAICGGTKKGTVIIAASTVQGEYTISDGTFGLFECLYADTPPLGTIRFTDACGKIGMKGNDRYGDAYKATFVSATDTELTFTWDNTYGDKATTTLKRSSGTWPKGLN